jgi:peptidoglycan biosynthesis protein MviN/MurJ (putative lipid II flippase)
LSRELGVEGVAYAELIASVVSFAVSYPLLSRTLGISSRVYLANLWRPVGAAAVMGFMVHALVRELAIGPGAFGAFRQLIIGIPAGLGVYVIVLWALWTASGRPRGAETYLLDRASGLVLRARDSWQRVGRRV